MENLSLYFVVFMPLPANALFSTCLSVCACVCVYVPAYVRARVADVAT